PALRAAPGPLRAQPGAGRDRPVPAGAGLPDAHEPRLRPRDPEPAAAAQRAAGLRRPALRVLAPDTEASHGESPRRPAAAPETARPGARPGLVERVERRRAARATRPGAVPRPRRVEAALRQARPRLRRADGRADRGRAGHPAPH